MNITDAIGIMESIAGVTDESTPAGEAWDAILRYICNPPAAGEVASYRDICQWLEQQAHWGDNAHLIPRVANIVRDALARYGSPTPQPEPEGLTDEQVLDLSEDDIDDLFRIAVAAQAAGTFPSDAMISQLTNDYGRDEDERRHCLAAARIALAFWGNPTPQPPADGEMAQLVALVASLRDEIDANRRWDEYHDGTQQAIIAKLLQHPQPVPVSERPWERAGWCDEQGQCWVFMPDIGTSPRWRLTDPRDIGPYNTHLLPANALPTPEAKP